MALLKAFAGLSFEKQVKFFEVFKGECKDAWKALLKGKGKGKGKDGKGQDGKGQDGKGKGKGKDVKGRDGKGKDTGKGKGKCKRSGWDAELEEPDAERMCMRAGAQTEAKKCARLGCNFQITWHPTHCCKACEKGADCHGPKCEKVLALEPSAPPMELFEMDTELKAKKLEEMGFGEASGMTEVLKSCGGDLSKALEALSI